jgi:hypothetical protein
MNANNPVYTRYNGMPAYHWYSLTPVCRNLKPTFSQGLQLAPPSPSP